MFGKEQMNNTLFKINSSIGELEKMIDIVERNTLIIPFDDDRIINSEKKFIEEMNKEIDSLNQRRVDFEKVENVKDFRSHALSVITSARTVIRYKNIIEDRYFIEMR